MPQNFYLATQMEHDLSSYFCWGPDDFCWKENRKSKTAMFVSDYYVHLYVDGACPFGNVRVMISLSTLTEYRLVTDKRT